jgi:triphosphoribosyl-dephospho-CoA synthase
MLSEKDEGGRMKDESRQKPSSDSAFRLPPSAFRDAGLCAQTACLWEATARKAGNVHRYRDFSDLTYLDFALSAAAIGPVLSRAPGQRVGRTVLQCIEATTRVAASNTNLGMVLLLAPLATVPAGEELRLGVARVLAGLDREDAQLVFEAIRLAKPGGLGEVPEQDVRQQPTEGLRAIMRLAEERDRIARQYVTDFADVFEEVVPTLVRGVEELGTLEGAIIQAQLKMLEKWPDSLIARKCGPGEAEEVCWRARHVLNEGWPQERAGWLAYDELDTWLRGQGHQRNPGTTADLLTAGLFVLLREGTITLPLCIPWSAGFEPV